MQTFWNATVNQRWSPSKVSISLSSSLSVSVFVSVCLSVCLSVSLSLYLSLSLVLVLTRALTFSFWTHLKKIMTRVCSRTSFHWPSLNGKKLWKKFNWPRWGSIHWPTDSRSDPLFFFLLFVKGQCMHMWWKLDVPEQTFLWIEKMLRGYQVRIAVIHLRPVVLTLTSENGPLGSGHPCKLALSTQIDMRMHPTAVQGRIASTYLWLEELFAYFADPEDECKRVWMWGLQGSTAVSGSCV